MKYFYALVLLFLHLSCSNTTEPVYNSVFFPLQTGNQWEYSGSQNFKIEVKNLVNLNNKFYYLVVKSFPASADTMKLRFESQERLLINFRGEDYLYIDFNLSKGNRWNTYSDFYGEIRDKGLNQAVPAGLFNNVTEVLFDNTVISDVHEFNRYAPEVGMISTSGFRRYYELVSARVNGKSYP